MQKTYTILEKWHPGVAARALEIALAKRKFSTEALNAHYENLRIQTLDILLGVASNDVLEASASAVLYGLYSTEKASVTSVGSTAAALSRLQPHAKNISWENLVETAICYEPITEEKMQKVALLVDRGLIKRNLQFNYMKKSYELRDYFQKYDSTKGSAAKIPYFSSDRWCDRDGSW